MGRTSNNPIVLDECLKLSIGYLMQDGYMQPNSFKSGVITWVRDRYNTGKERLVIAVKMNAEEGVLYINANHSVASHVQIVSKPSNLGRGKIYYFSCPFTGLLCKNLYLIGGFFVHRTYYPNSYYSSQIYSRQERNIKKLLNILKYYNVTEETKRTPYFKPHYKGKPTKAFLCAIKKEEGLQKAYNSKLRDWIKSLT